MKEKSYEMTILFDFYGDILTEKQQELFDLYYNEDLSLGEIAEHLGITRQGVRDGIVRAEQNTELHILHVSSRAAARTPNISVFIIYITSAFHCAAGAFRNKEHINVEAAGICYCINELSCCKIAPKDMLRFYIKDIRFPRRP